MEIKRLNIKTNTIETVDSLGTLQFIGDDKDYDLTQNNVYHCIGFEKKFLKIIDDTQDYYYYYPFDAHKITQSDYSNSGWLILDDHTGKITQFFDEFEKKRLDQIKRAEKNIIIKMINKIKKH